MFCSQNDSFKIHDYGKEEKVFFNHIFVNFVAYEYLSNIDNTSVENYCKQCFKSNESHQDDKSTYLDAQALEIKKLVQEIHEKASDIKNSVGLREDCQLDIDRVWCNINNNKNIDLPHSHPTALFSAVYYVKAEPNSGDIVFLTPNSAHQNGEIGRGIIVNSFNEFTSATWSIGPETGKLLIFPSWLTHYVQQNKSEEERISIAFDFFPSMAG